MTWPFDGAPRDARIPVPKSYNVLLETSEGQFAELVETDDEVQAKFIAAGRVRKHSASFVRILRCEEVSS